jgi:hypothetical protein
MCMTMDKEEAKNSMGSILLLLCRVIIQTSLESTYTILMHRQSR